MTNSPAGLCPSCCVFFVNVPGKFASWSRANSLFPKNFGRNSPAKFNVNPVARGRLTASRAALKGDIEFPSWRNSQQHINKRITAETHLQSHVT